MHIILPWSLTSITAATVIIKLWGGPASSLRLKVVLNFGPNEVVELEVSQREIGITRSSILILWLVIMIFLLENQPHITSGKVRWFQFNWGQVKHLYWFWAISRVWGATSSCKYRRPLRAHSQTSVLTYSNSGVPRFAWLLESVVSAQRYSSLLYAWISIFAGLINHPLEFWQLNTFETFVIDPSISIIFRIL